MHTTNFILSAPDISVNGKIELWKQNPGFFKFQCSGFQVSMSYLINPDYENIHVFINISQMIL